MKLPMIMCIALMLSLQSCASSSTLIELSSNQSMCITGKGPGQDGVINPYQNTSALCVVKNMGDYPFTARLQYKDSEVDMIVGLDELKAKESVKYILSKGYILYLDGGKKAGNAKITLKKYK